MLTENGKRKLALIRLYHQAHREMESDPKCVTPPCLRGPPETWLKWVVWRIGGLVMLAVAVAMVVVVAPTAAANNHGDEGWAISMCLLAAAFAGVASMYCLNIDGMMYE